MGICDEYNEIIELLLNISNSYEKCREIGIVDKLIEKIPVLKHYENNVAIKIYGPDDIPSKIKIAPTSEATTEAYFPSFHNYLKDKWEKTRFSDLDIKKEFENLMNKSGKKEAYTQLAHCIYKILEKDEYYYISLRITPKRHLKQ